MSRPAASRDERIKIFWTRVKPGRGCWEWTGGKQSAGYGLFFIDGKRQTAHRVAFQLSYGVIVAEKMDVCHRCDNRTCVRPDHLFLGTRSENVQDMISKGRCAAGSRHPKSKLTMDQVAAIKVDQRLQREIAKDYGVDEAVISRVKSGKAYAAP